VTFLDLQISSREIPAASQCQKPEKKILPQNFYVCKNIQKLGKKFAVTRVRTWVITRVRTVGNRVSTETELRDEISSICSVLNVNFIFGTSFAKFHFWPLLRPLEARKGPESLNRAKPMKIESYRQFSIRNRMSLLLWQNYSSGLFYGL